ncbi:MAG TPA: PD-(D/E)XK nuclease family protein [Conexibacter sp.]|nr:PD-(D/E)XK nuclease family protein [Conexibacter sp.]
MPLKLVIGPANAAKAGVVLDAFRAHTGRDPWLVVPTVADVSHYERELVDAGARRGGRVATFSGLTREIARRARYGARTIGPLQRERLVAQAIAAAQPEALAAVARTRGFLRAAGALIAELERTLITPQRFTAAVRSWPDAPPALHEAATIYDRYSRALERLDRVDADLFAWRALDALRAQPSAWGKTSVFLYGFDDLTPLELDAVETLSKHAAAEVTVALTYEPGRAAFAGRARFAEDLRALATEIEELPSLDDHYKAPARRVLHHVERQLFEPQAKQVKPKDAVRLLVAGGERAEVELIAAEVLKLLHDEQVPGEQIAVVLRAPGESAALIAQVFGAYGIPHALDWRVPLAHTALGRGVLALARCALLPEQAGRDDLLLYLRTPGKLERIELADRLELTLRRAGSRELESARTAWEEAPGGWPLRELDRLRGAAADGPAALYAALAREARTLFAAPHKGQAPVFDAGEEVDARALAVLLKALEDLAELAGADHRRAPALDGEQLLAALAELEVVLGEPAGGRAGAVLVADPLAIRARRFDTVVVAGLQEGVFPRSPRAEPFLSDEERWSLNSASGLRLAPREDALADERHLFYATISRPARRLILSCRDADEDGNPVVPSFFVDDVRALLTELPETHRPLSDVTWPLAEAPTPHERARAQALAAPRVAAAPLASLGPPACAALRQREVLSANALETYARCPVRWFVDGELRPERFAPDPEPLARGSLIHRVLERTLAQLDFPLQPAALPAADAVVTTIVAEEAQRFTLGRGAAAQAAAAHEVEADVRRLLRHEAHAGGGFAPAELELRFGMGEEGELPALELGGGALRLRGVIDRVDLDGAGRALVRDYKSGRASSRWPVARWAVDDQLQVALYMLAVRELQRREAVGGVYQPLRDTDMRARGVVRDDVDTGTLVHERDRRSREQLEQALETASARACELAARLLAGELIPTPETCTPQGGCAHPGICRVADA